ncbi:MULTISPECIES: hypothetical protein [unclassified Solwaraspora]|uniref:hypothetical protein n=1 Tax=unclassified Solwaraspora TaxID=2627926 RepID=UPI00248ACA76|nr:MULTISPECIES: hypothetical protein [unclassified Solwaraspora]WBC00031.1 hypothetical protein O7553_14640 [Solwaraspora sp. WMMA2059]WBC21423.1 hypothetical protein O7543_02730 [Solwaraspora sp. WMMA2080]WJK36497.1 hypothetical protein O7610_09180 [Solwaraspora sp. WMMA2065]
MKALRRTLVAFSAIIAVMLPANAAEAAVSNYMCNPIGGVLYQTNWWYASSWTFYFAVPASTTYLLSPPRTGGAHMVDVIYVH